MRAGSVDFFLKMITNRGVFCGQIPPALKKIINATRRRFFMRSFYLVMVLLENIVIMVIIDSNAFTEKANEILGERLNGTLIKVVPHPCTHFNSACFYLKTKVAISLANQRVRSSNDHHVKDKRHTYLLLSKSFGQNDY